MRKNIENIEIQDPPIEQLKKRSSCLKSTCATGLGCFLLFIIASLLLLKYASGPLTKETKELPSNFPLDIPIYDKDNINAIKVTPGENKTTKIKEIASLIPKTILSPILVTLENKPDEDGNVLSIKNIKNFLKQPTLDKRDTIEIDWQDLSAEPKFIFNYFKNELEKNKYNINTTSNDKNLQFIFTKDNLEGVLYINDEEDKKGTDYLSITVKFPQQ